MNIFQQKISLHSDASMCMGSPNTKFHWILYNNGGVRTHAQCHPKLQILKAKTKFVFELIELNVFVKKAHCNQQKCFR